MSVSKDNSTPPIRPFFMEEQNREVNGRDCPERSVRVSEGKMMPSAAGVKLVRNHSHVISAEHASGAFFLRYQEPLQHHLLLSRRHSSKCCLYPAPGVRSLCVTAAVARRPFFASYSEKQHIRSCLHCSHSHELL